MTLPDIGAMVQPYVDEIMDIDIVSGLGDIVNLFGGDFEGFLTDTLVDLVPTIYDITNFFASITDTLGGLLG